MTNQQTQPKSPLSFFFSLGDKVTGGDPIRKASFDYYMMWIIFLAFLGVGMGNLWNFFTRGYQLQYLGWGLFGMAIMWFQYFNLKTMWFMRKNMKNAVSVSTEEDDGKIETVDEMMREFEVKK